MNELVAALLVLLAAFVAMSGLVLALLKLERHINNAIFGTAEFITRKITK